MTARFWAPQRPTIDPDAVVLAMLEPGDLGSAILAVHRAGAAALEQVAADALPSEAGLVRAMVSARAAVADLVVDSVAKSMDGTYAGLFVMDVFDDAEQGALSVYRTAVSKGVSPPVAAQRAGDIFGVPPQKLGRYVVAAADPKTSPVAARDLADRTLLNYVSQLVAAETAEISKVDVGGDGAYARAKPFKESDVVRDALGRFAEETHAGGAQPRPGSLEWLRAKLGLGTGAPEKVADEQVKEPPAAVRQTRQQTRQQQQTRQVRATATRSTAERSVATRSTATRSVAERAVADRARAERQAALAEINLQAYRSIEDVQTKALVRRADIMSEKSLLDMREDPLYGAYYDLKPDVVLSVSTSDNTQLRLAMAKQDLRVGGGGLTRLGNITDISHAVESPNENVGVRELAANRAGEVAAMKRKGTWQEPQDLSIEAGVGPEEAGLRAKARRLLQSGGIESLYDKLGATQLVTEVYTAYHSAEDDDPDRRVKFAIAQFDPNGTMNLPMVDEYVLTGKVQGYEEKVQGGVDYRLDPNQFVKMVAPPGAKKGALVRPQQFWDAENNLIVNRYFLEVISKEEADEIIVARDVHKADEGAYQRAPVAHPFRESDVVRDALGRFAEEHREKEQAIEQTPVVQQRRQIRQTRQVRQVATRSVATRATAERSTVERTTAARVAFGDALRSTAVRGKAVPARPPDYVYKRITNWRFAQMMKNLNRDDVEALNEGEQIELTPLVRGAMMSGRSEPADKIAAGLAGMVENSPAYFDRTTMPLAYMRVIEGPVTMAKRVNELFDNDKRLIKIDLVRKGDVVEFVGHRATVDPIDVVEHDVGIDWTAPVYLQLTGSGEGRSLDLAHVAGDIDGIVAHHIRAASGTVVNPKVYLYHLSNERASHGEQGWQPS